MERQICNTFGGLGGAHLVLIGPEQADGQLRLVPLAAVGAGGVPDGAAHRAPRHPHVGAEGAGAVAVAAVHEVAELQAVGVVLAQRLEEQVSPLARGVLRGVHHQVGACGRGGGEIKGGEEGERGTVPLSSASPLNLGTGRAAPVGRSWEGGDPEDGP